MAAIGEQSLRWFSAERVEAEPDLAGMVRDYSGLLYRVALSIVRNSAEAEDIVQDTFVRVLQQKGKLNAVVELRPWLVRIAWNLALDRKRRIRPEQMDQVFALELVSHDLPADDVVAETARMSQVLAAIEKLPRQEREVLLLSAMEDLSTAEIGKVVGRTESSVRSLLFRARTHLRERLRD
jgi:RNA polymerase sigma-70 factor (ECF subfamily)